MKEWNSCQQPPEVGVLVDLQFKDALGTYEAPGPFFLHDDGHWYLIEPPTLLKQQPVRWKLHIRGGTTP